MKKTISLSLIIALLTLSLVGCTANDSAKGTELSDAGESTVQDNEKEKEAEKTEETTEPVKTTETETTEKDTSNIEATIPENEPQPEEAQNISGWPLASSYELLTFADGSQRYLSAVDIEDPDQVFGDPNFMEIWDGRMTELNESTYHISAFYCSPGPGCTFACGTDNPDDIVKTQQLLDELCSNYGFTILYRWAN